MCGGNKKKKLLKQCGWVRRGAEKENVCRKRICHPCDCFGGLRLVIASENSFPRFSWTTWACDRILFHCSDLGLMTWERAEAIRAALTHTASHDLSSSQTHPDLELRDFSTVTLLCDTLHKRRRHCVFIHTASDIYTLTHSHTHTHTNACTSIFSPLPTALPNHPF